MKSKDWCAWRTHSSTIRAASCIPKNSKPWTTREGVALRGLPDSERVRDLLDTAFAIQQRINPASSSTEELLRGLMVDVSVAVQRKPWSTSPPTVTTRSMLYSFEKDVVLSGHAHMRLMGWPADRCPAERFSDTDLRALAGESYSVPLSTMLNFTLFCNPWGPWWKPG
jgi:hypothetical protein